MTERSVRLVLGALSGVVVARYLGPADLGLLSLVSAVFALVVPLASLGLLQVLVRDFSVKGDWRPVLASALRRQLPVAFAASAVGVGVVAALRSGDRDAFLISMVMAPMPVLATEQTIRALLQATGLVRRIVVVGVAGAVAATTVKLFGVALDAPVWVFGGVGTLEAALVFGGLALAVPGRISLGALWRHNDRRIGRELVREGAPLLVASLAVLVYMKADVLMLGMLRDDRETGVYASAVRLSEMWYFIPTASAAALWPRLARLHDQNDGPGYELLLRRYMGWLAWSALAAVAVVAVLADVVVRILYGEAFADAADVLRIHILASPFVFVGVAGSQWFVDRGLTQGLLLRSVAGAAINVVANIALIPRFGATGAALATLLAYALSGMLLNALSAKTRPLFRLQLGAFLPLGHHRGGPGRDGRRS